MNNMQIIEAAIESGAFNANQKAALAQEMADRLAAVTINPAVDVNAKFGAHHCIINHILFDLKWQSDDNFRMLRDALGLKFEGVVNLSESVFLTSEAQQQSQQVPSTLDWDDEDDTYKYD